MVAEAATAAGASTTVWSHSPMAALSPAATRTPPMKRIRRAAMEAASTTSTAMRAPAPLMNRMRLEDRSSGGR